MADWVIKCTNCGWMVWRSAIADTLDNYYFPVGPPMEVVTITCPHCGTQDVYTKQEMRYER